MLLTISKARDVLRLDGAENDDLVQSLLTAIPKYLEVTTGRDWNDEPVNPLAETTAGFILQLWYNPQHQDSERLKRTIEALLVALSALGRTVE